MGGVVAGIDADPHAINVCKILADEHPSYQLQFFCGRIENVISELEEGQFDLVLGLNVFHHLCKKYGWTNVKNLLAFLAEKVNAAIFELALKENEPSFQQFLPDDYQHLLVGFDYIKQLNYYKWNSKAKNERLLLYASKKFVYLEEFGLMKIDQVQYTPLKECFWRYFYCGDKFIKYYVGKSPSHGVEYSFMLANNSIQFLKDLGGKNGLPKFYGAFWDESNCIVVMEKLEGVPLAHVINDSSIDRWDILKKALQWLVFLEQHDYLHFDAHTYQFLYSNGKLTLVDYDHIINKNYIKEFESRYFRRLPFPKDYISQAFSLINEIFPIGGYPFITPFQNKSPQYLLTSLKKYIPLKKYNQLLALQDSDDILARMYSILFESADEDDEIGNYTLAEHELLAIEEYLDEITVRLTDFKEEVYALESDFENVNLYAQKLGNILIDLMKKTLVLANNFGKLKEKESATQFVQLIDIVIAQQKKIEQLEKIVHDLVSDKFNNDMGDDKSY